MALKFRSSPGGSLGVEVELQIVDRENRDLAAAAPKILERFRPQGGARLTPEIFQSMIEINSAVQDDVGGIRSDLEACYQRLREVCREVGVDLAAAGSHPTAQYRDGLVHPSPRFAELIDRNRWIARRLIIFGVHVHVGMRDGDHAMDMINGMLHYLPHVLALSASSPFWQGQDTGLASSRISVFESHPTAGHPCTFSDWAAFESFYDAAIAAGAITSIKDLWWDIRPHPHYGTVEVRVCDAVSTLSELISLVTLVHLLFQWLESRRRAGESLAPPPDWVLRENKWRASRWGLAADYVMDHTGRCRPLRGHLEALLPQLEPFAVSPDARQGLTGVEKMLFRPLSYQRQRRIFNRTGSLRAVMEALVEEFWDDCPVVRGGGVAGVGTTE